jgi:hypothetical protein
MPAISVRKAKPARMSRGIKSIGSAARSIISVVPRQQQVRYATELFPLVTGLLLRWRFCLHLLPLHAAGAKVDAGNLPFLKLLTRGLGGGLLGCDCGRRSANVTADNLVGDHPCQRSRAVQRRLSWPESLAPTARPKSA